MKRIIQFLVLAFVAVACQDDGPTVPDVDPQFDKPDCGADPTHPSCKNKDGDGDGGLYTAIDLQHQCNRCDGLAHDISEPDDDVLYVVGSIDQPLGSPQYAVVWTGTRANIGGVAPTVLPNDYGASGTQGINDDHNLIVGAAENYGEPNVPVVWEANGSEGWLPAVTLLGVGNYERGSARDVNNSLMIAGRLRSDSDERAAVWQWPSKLPVLLDTPDGNTSWASGLNNDGDVIGSIWNDVDGRKARLWVWTNGSHTSCDLPAGGSETRAWRIEDRDADGRVLVAGQVATQPAVWTVKVDVTPCLIVSVETIDVPEGRALDVGRTTGGWEAVGDQTFHDLQPMYWYNEGAGSELLHNREGYALVINSAGDIVGARTQKGLLRAVLWTK